MKKEFIVLFLVVIIFIISGCMPEMYKDELPVCYQGRYLAKAGVDSDNINKVCANIQAEKFCNTEYNNDKIEKVNCVARVK